MTIHEFAKLLLEECNKEIGSEGVLGKNTIKITLNERSPWIEDLVAAGIISTGISSSGTIVYVESVRAIFRLKAIADGATLTKDNPVVVSYWYDEFNVDHTLLEPESLRESGLLDTLPEFFPSLVVKNFGEPVGVA